MKRFWDKVEKTDKCWNWKASGRGMGYGAFKYNKKVYDSHRFSFFLTHGFLPKDCVLHTCDNRKCVRPSHLYQGTHKDNVQDMLKRKRGNYNYGADVSSSKLNLATVEKIRKEYKKGVRGKGARMVASKYRVSHTTILDIIRKKCWKNGREADCAGFENQRV